MKERVVETNVGIQGEFDVAQFDAFARGMRDKGYIPVKEIIATGIDAGNALEIGPGPDYVGLEWLKKTKGTTLTALEISEAMIRVAEKNAGEYGLMERVRYVHGNAMSMPFENERFDAAFSSGSLHEWENPGLILNEAHRVLKPGGKLFVEDLKRDLSAPILAMMRMGITKSFRKGLDSSIAAAYTKPELEKIIAKTNFFRFEVRESPFGLTLTAVK